MKALFALLSIAMVGCTEQTAENVAEATAYDMATVIGPIMDKDKWGPDQSFPFSFPGRIQQEAPSNPSNQEDHLIYEVVLPNDSNLISVHVWVDPADGHSAIPDCRAQAMVWRHNGGMMQQDLLGFAVTPDNDVPTYEYRYLLTINMIEPIAVKPDARIFVHVLGEYGKGFKAGLAVDTPEIVYEEP